MAVFARAKRRFMTVDTAVTPSKAASAVTTRAAQAGLRRTHLASRDHADTGRARMDSWRNQRSKSSANASAEPYRRAGFFSRHFRQIVSRSRSVAGLIAES